MNLPHLAQRLFNTPLALHPSKAEVIMASVMDRFGISKIESSLAMEDDWYGYDDTQPSDDIEIWQTTFLKESGSVATDLVFTNKSWRAFRLDTTIKDNAITFPALSPFGNQINAGPQVMKGAIYKGRWGNFDLWLYNDWFIDPLDNVEKPMIPDGAVIMSGADLMGTRAFGVILDPAFNYGPLAYAPKSWVKEDPAQRLILMQSSPLVIPSRVNASLCATVV